MRTLSPRGTFFVKFVFPIFWLLLGFVFLWVIRDPLPGDSETAVRFLVTWIFGFAITLLGHDMKRVRMDDTFLYVSDYLTEIKVSIAEITDVTQGSRLGFPWISVHFRTPTEFGSEISFMRPAGKPTTPHPLVAELKRLAQRAAAQQSAPPLLQVIGGEVPEDGPRRAG